MSRDDAKCDAFYGWSNRIQTSALVRTPEISKIAPGCHTLQRYSKRRHEEEKTIFCSRP